MDGRCKVRCREVRLFRSGDVCFSRVCNGTVRFGNFGGVLFGAVVSGVERLGLDWSMRIG